MEGTTQVSNITSGLSLEDFIYERHASQVSEMCRDVFGGNDYLPPMLPKWERAPTCFPRVLMQGSTVIAFCNMRRLSSEYDGECHQILFLEGIRVRESLRQKGVGTFLLQQVFDASVEKEDSPKLTRILSMTIPANKAMLSVFKKAGMGCRGYIQVIPSMPNYGNAWKTGGPMLQVLDAHKNVPSSAVQALALWQKVTDPEEIIRTVQNLSELGGDSCLLPGFPDGNTKNVDINTLSIALEFMSTSTSDQESRSTWLLRRKHKPDALLFRLDSFNPNSEPPWSARLSACVVDVESAECCVAFAGSWPKIKAFTISLGTAVPREALLNSKFLSTLGNTPFMLFETIK